VSTQKYPTLSNWYNSKGDDDLREYSIGHFLIIQELGFIKSQ